MNGGTGVTHNPLPIVSEPVICMHLKAICLGKKGEGLWKQRCKVSYKLNRGFSCWQSLLAFFLAPHWTLQKGGGMTRNLELEMKLPTSSHECWHMQHIHVYAQVWSVLWCLHTCGVIS